MVQEAMLSTSSPHGHIPYSSVYPPPHTHTHKQPPRPPPLSEQAPEKMAMVQEAMISTCASSCTAFHLSVLAPPPEQAPEKMAMVQKAMISTCASLGKPSIVARVVDTMAVSPRPTRCVLSWGFRCES